MWNGVSRNHLVCVSSKINLFTLSFKNLVSRSTGLFPSRQNPFDDDATSCDETCVTTAMLVVWRGGNALVSINQVNLRRTRLVLGWVTLSGSVASSRGGKWGQLSHQLPQTGY